MIQLYIKGTETKVLFESYIFESSRVSYDVNGNIIIDGNASILYDSKRIIDTKEIPNDFKTSENSTLYANWTLIAGNYQNFEYYSGVDVVSNPSGNTSNLKSTSGYNSKDELIFKQTFLYDSLDNVIKIIAS